MSLFQKIVGFLSPVLTAGIVVVAGAFESPSPAVNGALDIGGYVQVQPGCPCGSHDPVGCANYDSDCTGWRAVCGFAADGARGAGTCQFDYDSSPCSGSSFCEQYVVNQHCHF